MHVDVVVNDFAKHTQTRVATVHTDGDELVISDVAPEHEHYIQQVVAQINKELAPADRLDAIVTRIAGDYMFTTAPHNGSCPFGRKKVLKLRKLSSTR